MKLVLKVQAFIAFAYKLLKNRKFRKAFFYNYYSHKKIKDNYVLYESFHGTIFGGNPYAIFKYLIENDKYNNLYHIITVKDINHPIAKRYKDNPRVKIIKTNSQKYIKYLETCKYVINNTTFRPEYLKRKDQIYINTWHATLLKSLGAHTKRIWEARNLTRNFINSDIIVMPNKYTKDLLLKAYYIEELYNGVITDIGYPRNDLIFKTNKKYVREIMKVPKNKKVILYAPTWRGEINKPLDVLDKYINYYKEIKNSVSNEYVVFLKLHSMVYRYISEEDRHFLVPFDVDTNEILSITDILITDYSGIMFDYMNTQKPILLFQFDVEYYVADRGDFYLPLESLPAPIFYDVDSLCKAIEEINIISSKYKKKYKDFAKKIVYADDGNSTKNLVEYVFENKKNKKIYINSSSEKKKILFCISDLSNDQETNILLETLNHIDYSKYTVSILLSNCKLNQSKQLLINKNVNLLYVEGNYVYSLKEYINLSTFLKTGYVNKKINSILETYSQKNMKRFVGNLKFDNLINFCSKSAQFNILTSLGIDAKKKILIIGNNIENTKSNKKAYSISTKYFDEIYVNNYVNINLGFSNTIELSIENILKML